MTLEKDVLDAINLLIDKKLEKTTKIYYCRVIAVSPAGKTCNVQLGSANVSVKYYGEDPNPGRAYRVFVPKGNTSDAFILN